MSYPCILHRERKLRTLAAMRRKEKERRKNSALAVMQETLARQVPREQAISTAIKSGATYQAVADELGLSRQRVHTIEEPRPLT